MPIPKPSHSESEDAFISRCMRDDTMTKEYEDQDQRLAVCSTQWANRSSNGELETRVSNICCEYETRDGKKEPVLSGYAAVYNTLSEDLGGFRELFVPGAFRGSLKTDVRALVDHDTSKVIGRTTAGTLTLSEDAHGVAVKIRPPDTSAGRDVVESVKRGDIDGMSIGFQTVTDEWHMEAGEEIREVSDAQLHEVSIVTFPAYPDTTIAARSRQAHRELDKLEAKIASKRRRLDKQS